MKFIYLTLYRNLYTRVILLLIYRYFEILSPNCSKYILTRTACLGNDSLKILNLNLKIIEHQKCRVDLFNSVLKGSKSSMSFSLTKFIPRSDIYKLYLQQVILKLKYINPPLAFIMDSYSELTDQRFTLRGKKNSFFFSNFNDIDKKYLSRLNSDGLLSENLITSEYEYFFKAFRKLYPSTPVIFINFPKKLETRKKFRDRHDFISCQINKIAPLYEDFYIIDIPEDIIFSRSDDCFPYHFSSEVYVFVSKRIRDIFVKYSISS